MKRPMLVDGIWADYDFDNRLSQTLKKLSQIGQIDDLYWKYVGYNYYSIYPIGEFVRKCLALNNHLIFTEQEFHEYVCIMRIRIPK